VNQPLPLVEQLKSLEHLQELDLKIDSIKKSETGLPVALKVLDDALGKVKAGLDLKKNLVLELEKVQRQTQAALDLNQDRMTRSNAKLDGVQNTQEFQAANKEIEQLKKLNGSLDEQTKKSIADIELARIDIVALEEQFNKLNVERESEAAKISGQVGKHQADISSLLAERKSFSSKVERATLALYDRVRAARGGLGIVPSVGGRCKGCNMMLPPQLYNEVQRCTTLYCCPSCHRLLYLPVSPGSPVSNEEI
jgi:predicted  nucleic acid-binding Zn-ribbon protein